MNGSLFFSFFSSLLSLRSGIQTLPHNAKVHYNYANFLKDKGQNQAAIRHYKTALRSVCWVGGCVWVSGCVCLFLEYEQTNRTCHDCCWYLFLFCVFFSLGLLFRYCV